MKRAIRIGAIVVGIIIVILIALPFLVDVNAFRPKLESELSTALGRQVTVGNLSLSLFSGSVSADNISIGDDPAFSKNPFVTAKSLKVGVEVMPLIFSKTLHVTGITLEQPEITLLRGANDTWNFSSLGKNTATAEKPQPTKPAEAPGSAPPANQPPKTGEPSGSASANQPAKSSETLSVDKLSVSNGRLLVGTANSSEKPTVYDKVNIDVADFSATTQSPFTVTAEAPGGGDLSLKGKFGPINAADAAATPFDATLTARKLNLATSGFVQPSTGIQGMADFDGTINSNGQQAKTSGTAKADKLKLAEKGSPSPEEVQVKYATDYNLKSDSGTLTQGDISIGKAVAHLTGGYGMHGQTTSVNVKLDGNEMPVDELEAFLPAVGVVLPSGSQLRGGTLSANLGITGTTDKPVITGPIKLSNSKLAGFDLGSKLSAISALSGKSTGGKDTSIQNFSTNARVAPDGTQANDINLTIPALGVVTGAGTVSPSGALNFHMNANLSGGAVGGALQQTALGSHTGNGIPFMIEGTTSDPKFVPDVKGMAGSAVQQAISGKVGESKGTSALGGLFGKKKH
jgi:AsmA protein